MKKSIIAGLMVLALPALLSCGGGDGGGTSASVLTRENVAGVSGEALSVQTLLLEPSFIGAARVSSAPRGFLSSLLDQVSGTSPLLKSTDSTDASCSAGGTKQSSAQWEGDSADPEDYTATITYQDCKEGTETWSGTIQVTYQGPMSAPTRITTTISSLTYSDATSGQSVSATGLTVIFAEMTTVSGSVTLTGGMSGTTGGRAFNSALSSYIMTYRYEGSDLYLSLAGQFKPSCAEDWITVSTVRELRIPGGSGCPEDGELKTASGSDTALLTFGAGGSASLTYNGSAAGSYSSCSDLQGLCSL